ncbi:NifU family protein [Candidatus Carsonella ruddii]|nr:NifU family protein [Candidatus Carsonella ruddii]
MYILKIYNYNIYITDSCYKYFYKNKKNKLFYKIFIKNKGKMFSKTKIHYSIFKNNIFNKLIKIKNINFIIDVLSLCFLNNTCIHYSEKIIINSPNSFLNLFLENKILSKIIFLIFYIINKKLILHNGYIKINFFNFDKKILYLLFNGECKNCNLSIKTFNKFVIKILKKIKIIKTVKLNE